jgi:hypothetical protein
MKSYKRLFILALAIGILSVGSYALTAHAQDIMTGLKTTAGAAGLPGKPSGGFEVAIGKIIGSVMGLVGTLLFVYMLYGGARWMLAGGESKAVQEAQAIIRNAIIGLVIIVFAYTLANYVITTLSSVSSGASTPTAGTTQQGEQCGQGTYAGYLCVNSKLPNLSDTYDCPAAPATLGCTGDLACCKLK